MTKSVLSAAVGHEKRSHSALETLRRLALELNERYLEREAEVEGLLLALLARSHILFIGPPGTAKSALVRALCHAIDGVSYFQQTLTKDTTRSDLFVRNVSVREREHKDFRAIEFHNDPSEKLGECRVAFLDEIFLAAHTSLTSLLELLADRTYSVNAGEVRRSPLLTLVGASNLLPGPEDGYLEHLLDRFLLRYHVDYLEEHDHFVSMLGEETLEVTERLTLDDLTLLQRQASQVIVTEPIKHALWTLRGALKKEAVLVSDRRWKQSLSVLRARALLCARSHVELEDIEVLRHALWTREREAKTVREAVLSLVNERAAKAYRLFEEAHTLFNSVRAKSPSDPLEAGDLAEAERRLGAIYGDFKTLGDAGLQAMTLQSKVRGYLQEIKTLQGIDDPFLARDDATPGPHDLARRS